MICSHRSFLVSNLGDLLTSLIFGEQPEPFPHIADYKRSMSELLNLKKMYKKRTIKYDLSKKKLEQIA